MRQAIGSKRCGFIPYYRKASRGPRGILGLLSVYPGVTKSYESFV